MRVVAGERFRSPQSHANQEHPPNRIRDTGPRRRDLHQHRGHSELLQVNQAIQYTRANIFRSKETYRGSLRTWSLRRSFDDDGVEHVEKQTSSQVRPFPFSIPLSHFYRHEFT